MENNENTVEQTAAAAVEENTGAPAGLDTSSIFDEDSGVERPAGWASEGFPQQEQPKETKTEPVIEQPVSTPAPDATPKPEDDAVDVDEYFKKELNFNSAAEAKAWVEEMRKPLNERSQKLYDALKAEKEDEIFEILSQKRELDRVSKLELTKADDAAEILKANLKYKHKDLTKEEVEYLFDKQHHIPKKPLQRDDQTDEEYQESLSSWKQSVDQAERGMIIEAKLAKPELLKYQSEIVLPTIPKSEPAAYQPTQEELDQAQKAQQGYLQAVDKGLGDFKGFGVEYKDEEVTIPINYEVTPEEKTQLKADMESLYSGWGVIEKRWVNPDGSYNTKALAEDLYLLQNKGKVFQKIANESANQRLAQKIKSDSNIQLTDGSSQQRFVPNNEKSTQDQMVDTMWDNY